jgi:hypothetical protein
MKLAASVRVVSLADWRNELFADGVLDHDSKNPRADFKRIRDGLAARRLIGERDGLVWVAAKC